MKHLMLLFLAGFAAVACAQPPKTSFTLSAPQGWFGEVIALPPGFAPNMKLKGVEDIRFAPGMFKAEAKDFFTYYFVFEVPEETAFTEDLVKREVMAYYQGLAVAVGKGKGFTIDPDTFTLSLKKEQADPKGPGGLPAGAAWTGVLKWTEPFATGKAQVLNLELTQWHDAKGKRRYLGACVSPLAREAPTWKSLRTIRDSFALKP